MDINEQKQHEVWQRPINTFYAKKETFSHFTKEKDFSQNDKVIIWVDFNARTGILPNYAIENEKYTIFLNLPDNYELDEFTDNYELDEFIRTRNNQDVHKNMYGEKFVDFSIATKLRILNGRILGDFIGKLTYIMVYVLLTMYQH